MGLKDGKLSLQQVPNNPTNNRYSCRLCSIVYTKQTSSEQRKRLKQVFSLREEKGHLTDIIVHS